MTRATSRNTGRVSPGIMKRRTFLLGGGTLATLSLGTTATSASLADAVSTAADFRVITELKSQVNSFTADPTTENTESQHTWELDIPSNEGIDRIEANYDFGDEQANFNQLTQNDVQVRFLGTGGNPQFNSVLDSAEFNGSTATFNMGGDTVNEDAEVIIGGDVRAGEPGIVNPGAGSYEPTLTFFETDGDSKTYSATLTTSTGDGFFEISNLSVSSTDVAVGNAVTFTFDVTNTGAGTDTRNVDLNLDRGSGFTNVDTQGITLDPTETKTGQTFTYPPQSADAPGFVAPAAGDTPTPPQRHTLSVSGGWTLTVSNQDVHTWTTEGIDFSGDIDTITVRYPTTVKKSRLSFKRGGGANTTITFSGSNISYSETLFNGDHAAEWDLNTTPTLDFPIEIEIDSLKTPNGSYEAEIELVNTNGDVYTATETFSN